MPEPIIIALIAAVAPIMTVQIGLAKIMWDMRKDHIHMKQQQSEIKNEVKNSHSVNLRDDMDRKHDEVMRRVDKSDEKWEHRFEMLAKQLDNEREWTRAKFQQFWKIFNIGGK